MEAIGPRKKPGPKPGITVFAVKPGPKPTPQVLDLQQQIVRLRQRLKDQKLKSTEENTRLRALLKKKGISTGKEDDHG